MTWKLGISLGSHFTLPPPAGRVHPRENTAYSKAYFVGETSHHVGGESSAYGTARLTFSTLRTTFYIQLTSLNVFGRDKARYEDQQAVHT